MNSMLYPSPSRRFMSDVAGTRRYHRSPVRAVAAARGGTLWVAAGKGWTCRPDRVAAAVGAGSPGALGGRP